MAALVGGFVTVGADAAADCGGALQKHVEILVSLWKTKGFQADFTRKVGLTPPCSYDNLSPRVAGFEPEKPELFHVPYCFTSSECRRRDSGSQSQSWIRPKH